MAEFQRGVRMGVDVGNARVGTALSDPDGILATPLKTLRRDAKKNSDRRVLRKLIEVNEVVEVSSAFRRPCVVGILLHGDGSGVRAGSALRAGCRREDTH